MRKINLKKEFTRRKFNTTVSARSATGSVTTAGKTACHKHTKAIPYLITLFLILGILGSSDVSAATWYASAGSKASDKNPGTRERPVRTVKKALSLLKPGDTLIFSAGTYLCAGENVLDGLPGLNMTIRSAGDGKVVFSGDGAVHLINAGSYNTFKGIEFTMTGEKPKGSGINIVRKKKVEILNCRFFVCHVGVRVQSSHYLTIENCEMAFSGSYGVHLYGSGTGNLKSLDLADQCAWVEIRNCWMHDAGWNTQRTEGYGITSNGAVEYFVIENCQLDNNTGNGILYEDWIVHSTARNNVIRGNGIAGIWIDNASMSIFDNNFLYQNNVGIWLSGEESSNRLLSDMVSIRNNIIVHNDWAAFNTTLYGKMTLLFSSNTRDLYFDNNTVAFNNASRTVGFQSRPPLTDYHNIWFRNNIFWKNNGGVGFAAGLDTTTIRFQNNLWDVAYRGDSKARTGDPAFVDPNASTPEGYRLKSGSPAIDAGMLLHENQLDFWNGTRPHLPKAGVFDLGAHEYGTTGKAHIGLDLAKFPFEVTPYKLQFNAQPKR